MVERNKLFFISLLQNDVKNIDSYSKCKNKIENDNEKKGSRFSATVPLEMNFTTTGVHRDHPSAWVFNSGVEKYFVILIFDVILALIKKMRRFLRLILYFLPFSPHRE